MQIRDVAQYVILLIWVGTAAQWLQAQSVADAARQQKVKAQTDSQTGKKAKVYTNEDIPESRAVDAPASDSKAQEKSAESSTQPQAEHGEPTAKSANDSAQLDLKLSPSTIKRPKYISIDWFVQNTSDHTQKMDLTSTINGPCGFHEQHTSSFELNSGTGLTDNMLGFVVHESNCAGTYKVELQASSKGKVLSSASATAQAE